MPNVRSLHAAVPAALLCAVAACASDPVRPPAGFDVTLTATPARAAPPVDPPAIAAHGDSVTAVATLGTSGCADYGAVAGLRAGALVVTITETWANRVCTAMVTSATFRAVTRRAPRGRYVVLLERRSRTERGRYEAPIELARAVVTLP